MNYDSGILKIYSVINAAEPGEKPRKKLALKLESYFGFETLGINRYYTALQAKQKISSVVALPGWEDVEVSDVCILEDGKQYRIVMVQRTTDDCNLQQSKLSLERIDEEYDI